MKWESNDHSDYRVVDYSGWRFLKNYGTLEQRSGVYIFANKGLQVKYVGKAGPRRMVDEIEKAVRRNKNYGATRVKALYTNSEERALSLKQALIDKYDPHNNQT